MSGRSPDFLGIGVQKAGTTWLFENLSHHPEVWLPPIKELQYFNDVHISGHRRWTASHRYTHGVRALQRYLDRTPRENWNYRWIARTADIIGSETSDEWYRSIFGLAAANQMCGEFTPEYSLLPEAGIKHIVSLAPHVRIIVSLRDPIERNWSHIQMLARSGSAGDKPDFVRLARFRDVFARADYPTIISRWREYVPKERMCVVFMDDIATAPETVMRKVCQRLGVRFDETLFPKLGEPVHVGHHLEIPVDTYDFLKQQLRSVYEETAEMFPRIGQSWLKRHYGSGAPRAAHKNRQRDSTSTSSLVPPTNDEMTKFLAGLNVSRATGKIFCFGLMAKGTALLQRYLEGHKLKVSASGVLSEDDMEAVVRRCNLRFQQCDAFLDAPWCFAYPVVDAARNKIVIVTGEEDGWIDYVLNNLMPVDGIRAKGKTNYLRLLGVDENATEQQLRARYRQFYSELSSTCPDAALVIDLAERVEQIGRMLDNHLGLTGGVFGAARDATLRDAVMDALVRGDRKAAQSKFDEFASIYGYESARRALTAELSSAIERI